ncbi:MAG: 23S rRNA (pseudouridine(1915)-N(3))-methyltransferase RlmH, partial [Candidatus Micrarchaeota archaeon]|nr:23S rRNA (pseudouridine(1915)-N(3))-methyltransferase RlmH [Candidatus Micrarchaeota archaeon]
MPSLIRIVAVGKIKEPYLRDGISEYAKRLRPLCRLEIVELPDEGMEKEAARLQKHLGPNTYVLDAAGKTTDSLQFALLVKKHSMGPLTFVIGSAEGADASLKSKARLLSLSPMTFTHEMARLVL